MRWKPIHKERNKTDDSVEAINDRAFEGCAALKEIRLPEKLTRIKEYTFFLCENLRTVKIPEGVTYIGKGAFEMTDLRKVRIPRSVVEIGKDAFPKDTKLIREE